MRGRYYRGGRSPTRFVKPHRNLTVLDNVMLGTFLHTSGTAEATDDPYATRHARA
jgi:hypothetical protein